MFLGFYYPPLNDTSRSSKPFLSLYTSFRPFFGSSPNSVGKNRMKL